MDQKRKGNDIGGSSTPNQTVTENLGETPRKIPSGKKKLKLPLYNRKPSKNSKDKQVTVDDILKPVKSLDDGVVSKTNKPSFRKSDVKKLTPSSSLEPAEGVSCSSSVYDAAEALVSLKTKMQADGSTSDSSQEEDSENIVPFHSQLLWSGSRRPEASQLIKKGTQYHPGRHKISERGSQNQNVESEANAAPSILEVSDFLTCSSGRRQKKDHGFTSPGKLSSAKISKKKSQTHSMTVNPSNTQGSHSLGSFPMENLTLANPSGDMDTSGESTDYVAVETDGNVVAASLEVQPSYTDPISNWRGKTRCESSGGKASRSRNKKQHAVSVTEDSPARQHDSVQDSTSALPSLSQDVLGNEDMELIIEGSPCTQTSVSHPPPSIVSENKNSGSKQVEMVPPNRKTPKKRNARGGGILLSFSRDLTSQLGEPCPATSTMSRPGIGLPLLSTASGKKTVVSKESNVDKHITLLNQCSDSVESTPKEIVPETKTNSHIKTIVTNAGTSKCISLHKPTVDNSNKTSKRARKKRRLHSFLEDDTELFEKLQTPSKCEEVDGMSAVDSAGAGDGKVTEENESEIENVDDFVDFENMPKSPVLDYSFLDMMKLKEPSAAIPATPSPIKVAGSNVSLRDPLDILNPASVESQGNKSEDTHITNFQPNLESNLPFSIMSAGGKAGSPSAERLENVETLLDKVDQDSAVLNNEMPGSPILGDFNNHAAGNKVIPDKLTTIRTPAPSGSALLGFASARGKVVRPSDKSLKKIETLLDKVDQDSAVLNNEMPGSPILGDFNNHAAGNKVIPDKLTTIRTPAPSGSALLGFASARGKVVRPSDKSLKKIEPLLGKAGQDDLHLDNETPGTPLHGDLDNHSVGNNLITNKPTSTGVPAPLGSAFLGLSSAKGKVVCPSAEKVYKVGMLLDKDQDGLSANTEKPGSSVLSGFGNHSAEIDVVPQESAPPGSDCGLPTPFVSTHSSAIAASLNKGIDDDNNLDAQDAFSAAPITNEQQDPCPSSILNFGVQGKSFTDSPLTNNVPLKESSSEWEEFPELKSSQAALLEQSAAKKESIASAANRQTMNSVQEVDGGHESTCGSETSVRLSTPVAPAESTIHKVHASTPLSSRTPLDPAVGTKRKSLPASLQLAAKKLCPSLRDTNAFVRLDDATRAKLKATANQIIASKKRSKIVSAPGLLTLKKLSSPQLKLMDLPHPFEFDEEQLVEAGDHLENSNYGSALGVTSENAVHFRFRLPSRDGFLLPNIDGTVGLNEVAIAFLTTPHVDPKLVPDGWVRNHYRWIVWKLASYERRFPLLFSERCLSADNVLLQLKYRYDREIDGVQRSAFKKLLERDAAPWKFICCVASVKKNRLDEGESLLEFELTDGWYSVWAIIDTAMVGLYQKGVIGIGCKLVVHGAEIINCEGGCDPLKVPSDVKLKISTNSVRRAKWFAKMGFMKTNSPIPNLLSDLLPEGGIVGKLTTVVVRKYPVTYMCTDADGKKVFRNERAQLAFQDRLEKRKSEHAEMVQEKLFKEAESRYIKPTKRQYTANEIAIIDDPEDLYSIWSAVGEDGEFMQSQLTTDQFRLILNYKDEIASKIRSDVQRELQALMAQWDSELKVTKLLKVRLMDCTSDKHAVLTIWKPSEEDLSLISENKAFVFYNVVSNATRDGVLQLSSSGARPLSLEDLPLEHLRYLQPSKNFERVVTPLSAFESPGFTVPVFSELDTVGVVVLVKLPEQSSGVTVVYLSDLEGHYLSITFWTSLSVFGCEDLLTEGSHISCLNLQWRSISMQKNKIPSVFASDISSFTKNPKLNHLRLHLQQMKSSFKDKDICELVSSAKAHLHHASKLRDTPCSGVGSPAHPLRSPASTPSRSTSVGNSYGRTPTSSSSKSTPAGQKLQKLSRAADGAPPLAPLPLTVATGRVYQNFKSPFTTPKGGGKP